MIISDTLLLRIALVMSFVGLIGLSILFMTQPVPIVSLEGVETTDKSIVQVNATIKEISEFESVTFLILEQSCKLKAVSFDPIAAVVGMDVVITGEITEYEGQKEVIIKSLKQKK